MEKGEALDVWIEHSGDTIDLFTGLQVSACSHCPSSHCPVAIAPAATSSGAT